MSRTFIPWATPTDPTVATITKHWQPLKDNMDLFALGCFGRNQYFGGSTTEVGGDGSAAATYDLIDWTPLLIPNANSQISSSSNVVVQVRFYVQVSNSAISITPAVYDLTNAAAASISGAASCTATNTDFSGTNQQQTITLTLPAGNHAFKAQVTIGGTPAGGYYWRALAMLDCYING